MNKKIIDVLLIGLLVLAIIVISGCIGGDQETGEDKKVNASIKAQVNETRDQKAGEDKKVNASIKAQVNETRDQEIPDSEQITGFNWSIFRHGYDLHPKTYLKMNKTLIEIVNNVHVRNISDKGLAIKIDSSNNAVPGTYDRPFGGIIACWGNINISGAHYYRFRYKENGGNWINIRDTRKARDSLGRIITRTPDTDGWFNKSDYDTDVSNYNHTALVHWNSAGKNGNYLLKLELADKHKNPLPGQTFIIPIRLDNTGPELLTFRGAPSPAAGVVVKDTGGNYRKCGTFIGGELIEIFGNFRDDYFLSFDLIVFSGNINVSGVKIGAGRYDDPILSPILNGRGIVGATNNWTGQKIGTLNLCDVPQSPGRDGRDCAYGIQLTIRDRAIVGYVRGYEFDTTHHRTDAFVTFNWDPVGCP